MTRSKADKSNSSAASSDSMFGAGSAALRRVMDRSFGRDKSASNDPKSFETGGLSEALAEDPVNTVIESELIPRLMMAHAASDLITEANRASDEDDRTALSMQTADFAAIPLHLDTPDLLEHMEGYLKDGIGFDTICIDVLAPAARSLGTMWEEDECDFVDVTMGLWRLQEVMRTLSDRVTPTCRRHTVPLTALFAPVPGDPHAFGAQMLDEIFAKAGWVSDVMVKSERRELLDRLSQKPIDVVGLSVTRDSPVSAIASLIKTMRNISANRDLLILIGGNMVNANPGLVDEVGADGTGRDARETLALAERLVEASRQNALTLR